jgi:hypothetical protein
MTRLPQVGKAEIRVLLKPDCYVDFEQELTQGFEVLPPQENKQIFIHPEDAEACKKPTLFNQLANQLKEQNESDEEEEIDAKEVKKAAPHTHGPGCSHDHHHEHEEEEEEEVEEEIAPEKAE